MTTGPAVVIAGPTASGKSRLAAGLAAAFDGVVVNADSMQLYRDLAVVTARPGPAELGRAPHRLYGVLDSDRRCSAGAWARLAAGEIADAAAAGRLPVVVGGSGLYLGALLDGLHDIPPVPADVRAGLRGRLRAEGAAALHAELAARDPATAKRCRPSDGQRVVRALEVLAHTGRGLADWQAAAAAPPPARFFTIAVMPERAALYAACDRRFPDMLAAGAVAEVEAFAAGDPPADCPLWQAVGVGPILRFLGGALSRDAMIAEARRDTRRYAKRQVTWFRHRLAADLACAAADPDAAADGVSRFLLTAGR